MVCVAQIANAVSKHHDNNFEEMMTCSIDHGLSVLLLLETTAVHMCDAETR